MGACLRTRLAAEGRRLTGLWPAAISNLERGLRRDDELVSAYRGWLNAA
ncbi:XRE family transcriptional regulator [Streptomyces sp. NPDC058084]